MTAKGAPAELRCSPGVHLEAAREPLARSRRVADLGRRRAMAVMYGIIYGNPDYIISVFKGNSCLRRFAIPECRRDWRQGVLVRFSDIDDISRHIDAKGMHFVRFNSEAHAWSPRNFWIGV